MGVIAGCAQRTYGNIERNTRGAQRVVPDESSGERVSIGDRQAGEIFVAREPGKVVAPRLKPTILAESRCQIVIAARPVKSCCISSSRAHSTLIGPLISFEIAAASIM